MITSNTVYCLFNRLCGRIEVPAVTVGDSSGQATEVVGRARMVTHQYFRWLLEQYKRVGIEQTGRSTMTTRTLVLDDLKGRTLEDLLREVARQHKVLRVRLPEGETVAIQPVPRLKPLPVLEGFVPKGWKDAIYE